MDDDSTKKPQMPRMPWYPSAFYATTRTWPFIARAVYRELLDIQWDAGGLPAEPDDLRAMLGVSPKDWRTAWPYVGPKFQPGVDGLLRNARLEQHRERATELQEHRRRGAQSTNRKRWGTVVPLHPEGDSA